MTFTKSILLTLFMLLPAFSAIQVRAQETRSDYKIQMQFREQLNRLQDSLETVSSVDSARSIIESIKELEKEYQEYEDLLDQALFPSTYAQEMEELKESSVVVLGRLKERQQRTEKLEQLQKQLSKYEQNLEQLTSRTDSLREAMKASVANERQQANLLETYREGLEKRDRLILAFIDSMIVAYRRMDLQSLKGLENLEQRSELEDEGNALKLIHEITLENLQILQNNEDNLRLQDYIRMSEVQQEFQQMWESLGSQITSIYAGEDSEKLAAEVEQNISEWNQMLQEQTFTTLSDSLKAQGIEIQEFSNAESLYTSLNSYLTRQIEESRDGSDASYEEYQQFLEFWNKVELRWAGSLVDAGILTSEQLREINAKVDTWSQYARPDSDILIWLLGLAVIIVIVLAVLYIRERQNKAY